MEHWQDGGRKSGGPEAEFQEWDRKNEHASCQQRGEFFPNFGFHCRSVFETGLLDSDKSKLVHCQAPSVPTPIIRNSGHSAGTHWHG